jgi:hypothetical protein
MASGASAVLPIIAGASTSSAATLMTTAKSTLVPEMTTDLKTTVALSSATVTTTSTSIPTKTSTGTSTSTTVTPTPTTTVLTKIIALVFWITISHLLTSASLHEVHVRFRQFCCKSIIPLVWLDTTANIRYAIFDIEYFSNSIINWKISQDMRNYLFHNTDCGLSTVQLTNLNFTVKYSMQQSVSQAASICSSLNMSLLSIESIAKLLCLFKLIPAGMIYLKKSIIAPLLLNYRTFSDYKLSTFITSGINEVDRCDVEGEYSWCSQNSIKLIPDLMKSFLKPSLNASRDRCLAFNASSSADNSSAMMRTSCINDHLPFICEPQCTGPICPAASECVKNVRIY